MIATGLWIWDEIVPDFRRTFDNIDGFLAGAHAHGGLGIINTGWHDSAQALYRTAFPGMAYGAVAAWEHGAMDHGRFFQDYAQLVYPGPVATEVAAALQATEDSRKHLEDVLGRDLIQRFWEDLLAPERLKKSEARMEELRQARLAAETAEEHLLRALEQRPGDGALTSQLIGVRMLDYLGQKHIYASQIAGYFRRLGANPSAADVYLFLGRQASLPHHSRAADLMDRITELREDYRRAWRQEYESYRLGTALGRWDAEYEYWRRLQARLWELADRFKDGDTLPPLEAFRPRH